MSRNTQYQFISTDTNALVSALVSGYEKITGVSVQPASPEKLFIQWVADIIIQERRPGARRADQIVIDQREESKQ